MKLSIQTIVFNAESILPKDMLRKNIEQWVEIADEIIIVEGATKALTRPFDGDAQNFTPDGKSTDATRDILQTLEKEHSKIKLILANGFWNGKTAMCNAASKIATGDYLWQVDQDEFYHENDIPKILNILEKYKPDAVHFYANHFWGGYWTIMDNNQPWGNGQPWMRIFKNVPGSHWISHEPPEYQLADGTVCNKGHVINREQTDSMGIKMFHYGYVNKSQVDFKAKFYRNSQYVSLWDKWLLNNNTPILKSVTTPFLGEHPKCIQTYL
jgi:hypothetical protein